MTKEHDNSIVYLIQQIIHEQEGRVDAAQLEEALHTRFPLLEWDESYWHWYVYQCTLGRFTHLFTKIEKNNLLPPRYGA